METSIDFSTMEFYDFYSLDPKDSENSQTLMCEDFHLCQECYYR